MPQRNQSTSRASCPSHFEVWFLWVCGLRALLEVESLQDDLGKGRNGFHVDFTLADACAEPVFAFSLGNQFDGEFPIADVNSACCT